MEKPLVALFASIIAVSFAAIFVISCNAPPLSIAFFRIFFTTLILLPFVIWHKKTRREIQQLSQSTLGMMIIIGIILAAHFALWITSLTKTSVASSVILVTAHPMLVGPIAYFLLKEKLSKTNSLGIGISVAGVIILVYGNYGFTAMGLDTLEGNILAMLGGVAAGLYILGGRKLRKKISVLTYAFIVYSIASIVLLFLCLVFNAPLYGLRSTDYQLIFLMAITAGIFGHTLYNWSLKYINASLASVALLGEPIGSSVLAYLIPSINQSPSLFTLGGGSIILLGIYLTSKQMNGPRLSIDSEIQK